MHILTVVFGYNDTHVQLFYQSGTAANGAAKNLANIFQQPGQVQLTDDYGTFAVFADSSIRGFWLRDSDQSQAAEIEAALHQARTQAKAQRLAQTDPGIASPVITSGAHRGWQ